jgi:CRP/FNR family transcriptional regulator, cyclic AMP receptor protein
MTFAAPMSALGLARNDLLADVPRGRLEQLASSCSWRKFEPGQEIVSRHTPADDVHLIVDGSVRIHVHTGDGREVLFKHVQEGGIVGDFGAIDGGLASTDAHAVNRVLSATMRAAEFRQLLRDERGVQERYVQHLIALVRTLTDRIIELSTLAVQNRIRSEVLRQAHAAGAGADTVQLSPAPRHADLAAQVGTTREQVTRELSALTRQGLLQKSGGTLVVTGVHRLEDLVRCAAESDARRPRRPAPSALHQ